MTEKYNDQKVDVLAIGAHPDDIEIGVGGLLAILNKRGILTGVTDLTRGERGTKGDPDTRRREASEAAKILGLRFRDNLDLGDGNIADVYEQRLILVDNIRAHKPAVILAPWYGDIHPDHIAAGYLVRSAFAFSRLKKYETEYPAHSPKRLFYYYIHRCSDYSFLVDITEGFEKKLSALAAFKSQMSVSELPSDYVPIATKDYLHACQIRAEYFGMEAGCQYAEAIKADAPLVLSDPSPLLCFGDIDCIIQKRK